MQQHFGDVMICVFLFRTLIFVLLLI